MSDRVRLSVLDTSPIVQGATARQALHNTLDLARLADELGFHRYWVPEHHGMSGVASAAPAVLVARIAAERLSLNLIPEGAPLATPRQGQVPRQALMVRTLVHGHADRRRSCELLSELDLPVREARRPDFPR